MKPRSLRKIRTAPMVLRWTQLPAAVGPVSLVEEMVRAEQFLATLT